MTSITQHLSSYLVSDLSNLVVSYFKDVMIAIGEDTSVSVYDTLSKTWMPLLLRLDLTSYVCPTLINIGSKLYAFEAHYVTRPRDTNSCYDLITAEVDPIPVLSHVHNYVMLNQSIYAIDMDANIHQFTDRTWHYVTTVPYQYTESASVAFEGHIYIIGGYKKGEITNRVQTYNPITRLWSHSVMNYARYSSKTAVVGNTLYVINANLDYVRRYSRFLSEDMHVERRTNSEWEWVSFGDMDSWCERLIGFDDRIYFFQEADCCLSSRVYNPSTQQMTKVESPPSENIVVVNSYFLN